MQRTILKIKLTMREHCYSFYSFVFNGFSYVAGLSVKDNDTFFEVVDGKGNIIHSEII